MPNQILSQAVFNGGEKELIKRRQFMRQLCARYQAQPSKGHMKQILAEFANQGEFSQLEPGFQCDYGFHISLGKQCYINLNCVFLDSAAITLGDQVLIGPGVHIYTVDHPRDSALRATGEQTSKAVTIGAHSWIGGQSIILPGIHIGEHVIVAAGSVVTQNIPSHCKWIKGAIVES